MTDFSFLNNYHFKIHSEISFISIYTQIRKHKPYLIWHIWEEKPKGIFYFSVAALASLRRLFEYIKSDANKSIVDIQYKCRAIKWNVEQLRPFINYVYTEIYISKLQTNLSTDWDIVEISSETSRYMWDSLWDSPI